MQAEGSLKHIAVIGAGAMGTLFGARLARAGHSVVFIDADRDRVAAINADGVFEDALDVQCQAFLPGEAVGTVDLIIVFTKSMFTGEAVRQNLGLVGPGTAVLTLQNGLGNAARIAELVGGAKVLCGITNWPADLIGHGRIHVGGKGVVKLWSLAGDDSQQIHEVAQMLDEAGLAASAEPNVETQIWEKVIFNAALNGVAALTGMTVGQIGDSPPARTTAMSMVQEGIAIALGNGIPVDGNSVLANVEYAMAHHRNHKASMLQDVEAGRTTEVDSIQGGLLDAAAAIGMEAPTLATCTALLRAIDMHHDKMRQSRTA